MPPACPRKPKWEEEEEEEELEEDLEEDEEVLGPLGSPGLGPAALVPHRAPPSQAFRGDSGPRALGGQERQGASLAHAGGTAHVVPPLQPPDHGDWTYEEQFKQVCALSGGAPRRRHAGGRRPECPRGAGGGASRAASSGVSAVCAWRTQTRTTGLQAGELPRWRPRGRTRLGVGCG